LKTGQQKLWNHKEEKSKELVAPPPPAGHQMCLRVSGREREREKEQREYLKK
jgi:hypothetical protein